MYFKWTYGVIGQHRPLIMVQEKVQILLSPSYVFCNVIFSDFIIAFT